jgi:hypothetical protein
MAITFRAVDIAIFRVELAPSDGLPAVATHETVRMESVAQRINYLLHSGAKTEENEKEVIKSALATKHEPVNSSR